MIRALFIFGTRPEAIKLCPVIEAFRGSSAIQPRVAVTAQHRGLLDQVLEVFNVQPHHDLDVMRPGQTLYGSTSRIIAALEPVLAAERPDIVLVQGDTTTTFCGALAAFYARIPVGHVEAGLRTGDPYQPFPEEMNRLLTSRLASLHFAATEGARENLLKEGIPDESISVTGNTGIDAVLHVRNQLESGTLTAAPPPGLHPTRRLILVTAHRRESFGPGFEEICLALRDLAARPDVQIVYPVHPNPNVREPVERLLRNVPNLVLTDPLPYVPFIDLMRRAHLLITDSGGVQEEGPSLGKPIIVMRDKTERPEAVHAGTVILAGPHRRRIVEHATHLLEDQEAWKRMTTIHNPYGDGQSSTRIHDLVVSFINRVRGPQAAAAPPPPHC